MAASESDEVDEEQERQVLLALEESGPLERDELAPSAGLDEDTTRNIVQELLYSGRVTTTPDWKYEAIDEESDE